MNKTNKIKWSYIRGPPTTKNTPNKCSDLVSDRITQECVKTTQSLNYHIREYDLRHIPYLCHVV